MDLPSNLPENVLLLSAASKDLARILRKNREEFHRIWEDLIRLGKNQLPPQGKKKLKSSEAFQIDSGRYRIVYSRQGPSYMIWAVFPKPEQENYFKHF